MDYASAIAIAIPSSTFIVMVGTVVIKFRKHNNPGNQFVGQKEFKAVTGGIANELKLAREEFRRGIDDLREEIRSKRGPD